jgi:His/Glu/Gln/Arg/opine family amino acid ABC transporter permease subunit
MSLFVHYLSLPYLIEGIWFTVVVTALGLAGGLILGLILAAMQLSRFWMLAAFARGYTVIFRGTPLILQMVFAYDALPHIGIKLSAIGAAGLALAANEAPFIAEMLRAGVLGIDRGQVSAGQALGMTPSLLMRRIIAPQAIRMMIPAFGNETVSALKNSSLASVISVQELTLRSTQLASSTFDFFSIFFASGLIYLVLTTGGQRGSVAGRAGARSRPAGDAEPVRPFHALVSGSIAAAADISGTAFCRRHRIGRSRSASGASQGSESVAGGSNRTIGDADAERRRGRRQRTIQGLRQTGRAGRC